MSEKSVNNSPSQDDIAIQENLIIRVREQDSFLSFPLVRQGTTAIVLRNGRVEKVIPSGRSFLFRIPFQKLEIVFVDSKIRNLSIISKGEFLTSDHWRINVSLWISYQVTDPARVAVEYAEPVHALYNTIKDLLGQLLNQQDFQTLSSIGRQVIRQGILENRSQVEQILGITLTDARVDELTLPKRVGAAFDERRVAQMEGEAEQWRLRGKWQDLPESVRRNHFQEELVSGSMFINPPLPAAMDNPNLPDAPRTQATLTSLPSGETAGNEHKASPTAILSTGVWGQIVITGGLSQGTVFPLRTPVITIGRAGDNDIALQDPTVSGHHARIEQQGEQILLIDTNSSNGTLVNGQRITQTQLTPGDVIMIGNTPLRLEVFR